MEESVTDSPLRLFIDLPSDAASHSSVEEIDNRNTDVLGHFKARTKRHVEEFQVCDNI
jgi:hypothetical protein